MQLMLEVVILLLLLYVAFLKSYFQEKGKNVATKEDVEEITSLVESVKSQLQFSLQAKLSFRAEEHQALVDYFSKYSAWLSAITDWVPWASTRTMHPDWQKFDLNWTCFIKILPLRRGC